MLSRISLDSAGPRDAAAMSASLARLPDLHAALERLPPRVGVSAQRGSICFEDLREKLERRSCPNLR